MKKREKSRGQVRRFVVAVSVAVLAVLIDQGSKAIALAELSETNRIPLLSDLFGLQLAFNPGAILSFGSEATWVITVLAVVASVFLVMVAARARTTSWAVGIGLILGGAVGNLLDRLFAPPAFGRGHVTDFLAYGDWFIGNLADVFLGAGVILLLLILLFRRSAHRHPEPDDTPQPE